VSSTSERSTPSPSCSPKRRNAPSLRIVSPAAPLAPCSYASSDDDGGIYNDGDGGTATVTFTDPSAKTGTSVNKNTAASGGGIYNNPDGGTATVTLDPTSGVSHNTATEGLGFGGGIFNNGGTLIGAVAPPASGANVKNNTPDNIAP